MGFTPLNRPTRLACAPESRMRLLRDRWTAISAEKGPQLVCTGPAAGFNGRP